MEGSVQTVKRAVDLLRHISTAGAPVGVRECARALGLPRSAVQRIARTLADAGMLASDPEGRYRIGPLVRSIADGFAEDHGLVRAALREMEANLRDVTTHFGRLDQGRVLVLAAREGQGPIKVSVHPGDRYYVHCTAIGKALMAALPAAEVAEMAAAHGLPARTPRTLTTLAALSRDLATVRRRGFSVSMEESTLGVASIGAPIRNGSGAPRTALSVSVPVQDIRTREALDRLAERVLISAGRIAASAPEPAERPTADSATREPVPAV